MALFKVSPRFGAFQAQAVGTGLLAVFSKVAVWRQSGGLGLPWDAKNFLGRVDF